MTLKYCHGPARLAETRLGWNRKSVALGLEGQLEPKDSLDNGSAIERGKIQRMTAA